VSNAQKAFTGEWSKYTGEKRGIMLHKLADLILEHADELAYFESFCSGIPISFVKRGIPSMASVFRCKLLLTKANLQNLMRSSLTPMQIMLDGPTNTKGIFSRPLMGFTRLLNMNRSGSVLVLLLGMLLFFSSPGNLLLLWQPATP
jgi:acyl-CoA reductase-like NAD-dependent aldehyde dehydrogenase